MIQGSAEWFAARLGKVTASRVGEATARLKNGNHGADRTNYMVELIVERLTGEPAAHYVSPAMAWGTEMEPHARSAYAFSADCDVVQVGFVPHPTIAMAGASPDGYVGAIGLVQFKCPNTAIHIATLLGAKIDCAYVKQCQWELACTGRAWCDWVSYDPRLPGEMSLFVERIQRDNTIIATLEADVIAFLAEIDEKIAVLNDIAGLLRRTA